MNRKDVSLKTIIERYSIEEQVRMYDILKQKFEKIPCKILSYNCIECSHTDSGKLDSVLNGYFKDKYEKLTCIWSMDSTTSGLIDFKEEVSFKFINDFFECKNFTDLFELVEMEYEEKCICVKIRKL